jgi:hypothetical protein
MSLWENNYKKAVIFHNMIILQNLKRVAKDYSSKQLAMTIPSVIASVAKQSIFSVIPTQAGIHLAFIIVRKERSD